MRVRAGLLVVIGLVVAGTGALAETLGSSSVLLKGESAFVPLRAVFEWLGATVDYSGGRISARRGDISVSLRVGSRGASVNGSSVALSAAPFLSGGTTYVPLRFVAESLGATVAYNSVSRSVTISHDGQTATLRAQSSSGPSLAECSDVHQFGRLLVAAVNRGDSSAVAAAMLDPLEVPQYSSMTGDPLSDARSLASDGERPFVVLGLSRPESPWGPMQPGDWIVELGPASYADQGGEGARSFHLRKVDGYWRIAGSFSY